MRQTVTVNTPRDLQQFKREFAHLVDVVKQADGKYVLYLHTPISPATRNAFITKAAFDAALSPAMRSGSPSAFSPHIARGQFLAHRLDAAYSAYQRAQAKTALESNRPSSALIRNRSQYLAVYGEAFGLYPPGRMGDFLNEKTRDKLPSNANRALLSR
jgi:hypothetical protein